MSKKEMPKAVAEVLKEISKNIKEYNISSDFKIVVKNFDDVLLKIYPKSDDTIFFQINKHGLERSGFTLNVTVNAESIKILSRTNQFNESVLFSLSEGLNVHLDYFLKLFSSYLSTLNELYPTELNFRDYFDLEQEDEVLIPEPDFYESKEKILPYSLKQISVKDFQGVKETEIEHIPVDTQWIFLVGENGFGKTTILQSIFLGLNGALDGNTNLLDDKSSHISVEYKSLEENVINYISDNKNPLMHLAAYGPGRLNLQGVKSENAEDRNNSVSYNLFNSDGFLFNINADLERLEYKDKKRFNLLKRAICTLIPNISNIQLNRETDQIEYIEKEINSEDDNITYTPLPFKKLASGFKSIIALAGDMIVRLSKNQPEVKDPSELKGIVLIDEIDLHLHPKLQKQLIGQFSKVFPKIQFIVSTHSPIPLLGAESNSVILKVNRTKEKGIQIEKVDIDLKNLTPNLVLTSGIFDMEDFISVQNENINEVRTEDSMTEMEENDKVAKYLEEFEISDANFPDELFLPKTTK